MTKDDLEKLLTDKPGEVKARGAVLFNAVGATMQAYNVDRSVANLRNMEAAKEAFDKFVAEIGGGVTTDDFDNLHAVLKYLKDSGWQASRQSIYRHHDQGKILPSADGKYTLRAVEKYAKTFLKQISTGKRVQKNTDDLQRQKLEQELKNLKLKNEREKFNFEKDLGLYVPRSQMDIEVASYIAVLVSGYKNLITSRAADWIAIVGGDHKKTGELITQAINDVDELTTAIARASEYVTVIEAASEAGTPEEHETAEVAE